MEISLFIYVYVYIYFIERVFANQLTSQLKKKIFPSSLVFAHWNSEKYADVGCFAGKVDKGQMAFPPFPLLGGVNKQACGGTRNFHPCSPLSMYPRRNVTHLGIWVFQC